jgi:hypothetical protein
MEDILAATIEAAKNAATPLAARTLWSNWETQIPSHAERAVKVALCASFTTQLLEPYIGTELLRHGIVAAPQHSPYHQIHAELLSPASTLRREPVPEVVAVLWRMEELMADAVTLLAKDPRAAREAAHRDLDQGHGV